MSDNKNYLYIFYLDTQKRVNSKTTYKIWFQDGSQEKGWIENDDLGKELCSFYRWRVCYKSHVGRKTGIRIKLNPGFRGTSVLSSQDILSSFFQECGLDILSKKSFSKIQK